MMGDERVIVPAQAEGVLQLGPAAENGPGKPPPEPDRLRHVAPGPAQQHLPAAEHADHGVVGPHVDRPVVQQEEIRDPGQPRPRVVVVVGDRLIGAVAAGQHHRTGQPADQQMVQRGVRQHHPELARARRHRPRDRGAGQPRQQHDRPPSAGQQRLGGLIDRTKPPGRRDVGRHQRERLVLAALALPQGRRGRLAERVDREVIAAEALDREHPALGQQRRRRDDRIPGPFRPGGVEQPQPGAAGRAAYRLSVEPPVGRIGVLGRAVGAQPEPRHRGQRPVVGDVAHDREPGTAVRAVDERVAEPAVSPIGQLGQAVGAGSGVGRHQRLTASARVARRDRESGRPVRRQASGPHRLDPRQRRRVALERRQKVAHAAGRSLDLDEHAGRVVAHVAGQPQPGGKRVDERAEAHPLDDALDLDQRADTRFHSRIISSGGRLHHRLHHRSLPVST